MLKLLILLVFIIVFSSSVLIAQLLANPVSEFFKTDKIYTGFSIGFLTFIVVFLSLKSLIFNSSFERDDWNKKIEQNKRDKKSRKSIKNLMNKQFLMTRLYKK